MEEYIRKLRQRGTPDDIIKQNLLTKGWPEDKVDAALSSTISPRINAADIYPTPKEHEPPASTPQQTASNNPPSSATFFPAISSQPDSDIDVNNQPQPQPDLSVDTTPIVDVLDNPFVLLWWSMRMIVVHARITFPQLGLIIAATSAMLLTLSAWVFVAFIILFTNVFLLVFNAEFLKILGIAFLGFLLLIYLRTYFIWGSLQVARGEEHPNWRAPHGAFSRSFVGMTWLAMKVSFIWTLPGWLFSSGTIRLDSLDTFIILRAISAFVIYVVLVRNIFLHQILIEGKVPVIRASREASAMLRGNTKFLEMLAWGSIYVINIYIIQEFLARLSSPLNSVIPESLYGTTMGNFLILSIALLPSVVILAIHDYGTSRRFEAYNSELRHGKTHTPATLLNLLIVIGVLILIFS